MKKAIHHIRRLPENTKRLVLHVLVAVFGFILVLLWIYSLGTNVASTDAQTKVNQDLKPFSVLKDNIINGYNQF